MSFGDIPGNAAASGRPLGQSVSAARLRHKPPRKAISAFSRGMKLGAAGEYRGAASEFEKTIALDPGFSEAHGNLAVEYTWLGRLDDFCLYGCFSRPQAVVYGGCHGRPFRKP
jgi:hypothetical protein